MNYTYHTTTHYPLDKAAVLQLVNDQTVYKLAQLPAGHVLKSLAFSVADIDIEASPTISTSESTAFKIRSMM